MGSLYDADHRIVSGFLSVARRTFDRDPPAAPRCKEKSMNLNLVVLSGRLAAPPELRVFESGARYRRFLVTVRLDQPRRRLDVIPVTWWDPPEEGVEPNPGDRIHVTGTVQRRFWSNPDGRRSRLEVIAANVAFPQTDDGNEGPG
jgi:single-strand DNA-binding protein